MGSNREQAGVYGRQSHGKKKSIEDQMDLGHELCLERGWEERAYSDKVSASWFGKRQRGGWDELLKDLQAGLLDVLVLWESSRGERRNTKWSELLDVCAARGVLIHLIEHDETYDPRNPRHWETLASEGIKNQAEVLKLSKRVLRGVARANRLGMPPVGPCPYGYRRGYDPATGDVFQEIDPETGPIITEIIRRVSQSEPLGAIATSLNERGVTAPAGVAWYRERIRRIAENRTYLGERKHKNDWHPGTWPALTDVATFAAAGQVLAEPGRSKHGPSSRPGKQTHLLTGYAECPKCDAKARARGSDDRGTRKVYVCHRGHFQIERAPVDEMIRELVIARLSDPDLYAELELAADAADSTLKEARAEAAALRQRLDGLREKAIEGEISPESFALFEAGLLPRIKAAEEREQTALVPADLEGWVGAEEDVQRRWDDAPVQARRTVLKAIRLRVTLLPAGRNPYTTPEDRVAVSWE